MPRNNGVPPRLWFFTDDRLTLEAILAAAMALPHGSGIVVRSGDSRRLKRLLAHLMPVARRRRLVLTASGAGHTHDVGRHIGRRGRVDGHQEAMTASAHNVPELRRASRAGAALVFVSPVFATRSHPKARPLGPLRLAALVRASRVPVVALGGMTRVLWRRVKPTGAYGWAAVDGLLAD